MPPKRTRKKNAAKKAAKQVASKPKQVTLLGHALRTLGGLGGGAVGGLFGNPTVGSNVGSSFGAAISRWLGSGDYTVAQNSVLQRASTSVPSMHRSDQRIVVRHKEFVCEVVSAQAFTVQRSFSINPGLVQTFPWLSRIANSFQEYSIKGMVWHYVPTSGNAVASSNAALGSVMLQTSYRATDSQPGNKAELLNEFWSGEAVPSEVFVHPIECNPKENPFQVQYVRSGPVPAGDTQLMYDLGTTHLAVSGCQTTGNILGDLWVTYEIELAKPIVDSNATSAAAWVGKYANSTVTASNIFGTGTAGVGNFPFTAAANVLTIPVGYYGSFVFYVTFVGGASSGFTESGNVTASGATLTTLFDTTPSISRIDQNGASATGTAAYTVAFSVSKTNRDASATLTFANYVLTTGSFTGVYVNAFGTTDL
jgi:hypothetical protein